MSDIKNPLFSQMLHCGAKNYHFEVHEATSGSWMLRIREVSQSEKRKGEFDIIVYAEYLSQFLDAIDTLKKRIESEGIGSSDTKTA